MVAHLPGFEAQGADVLEDERDAGTQAGIDEGEFAADLDQISATVAVFRLITGLER